MLISSNEKFPVATRSHPNWLIALFRSIFVRTDVSRWKKIIGVVPTWDERNKTIAAQIPAGASVVDLGGGAQTLRQHLKPGCEYQPCDVIASTPDCIVCDFNAGNYPKLSKRYDYVVCSGILEYIREPAKFMAALPGYGHTILLSYNPRPDGASVVERLVRGWLSHLTAAELQSLFTANRVTAETIDTQPNGQVIFRLASQKESPAPANKASRPPRVAFMTTVHHNVGDEFIREGIRSFLDEALGQYDPYYVHKHDMATLHKPLLDEVEVLEDKFRDADIIVQAGAPVYWAFGPWRSYNVEWAQDLWFDRIFKLGPAKIVLNLGAGSCQGDERDIQPLLADPKCVEFAKQAAAACRWTTVRDALADEYLQQIGVEHDYLICPAFHAARRFEGGRATTPRDLLAVNLMRQAGHQTIKPQDPARWPVLVSELLPKLRQNHKLLFVAHDKDEADFQSQYAQPGEHIYLSGDFRDYVSVYSRVKGVVANRVHGAVCAAGFGRPAVIVGNDSRIGIARPIGIPAMELSEVTADWIVDALEKELARGEDLARERIELRETTAKVYISKLKSVLGV